MDLLADRLCKKNPNQSSQHSLHFIFHRQYFNTIISRRDQRILRSLMTEDSYCLKRAWQKKSPQRITCDGRFAFLNNYQTCIDCSSNSETPSTSFSLAPRSRSEKIEDAIIMDGTPESMMLPFNGQKAVLLSVTRDNFLLRIDLKTGTVHEKVKLGLPPVKFMKINWNAVDETFVITSKQYPQHNSGCPNSPMRNVVRQQENDEVIQFIVMSCMPLEFVAKFSVHKKIFGKNVVEAIVSLDILMVMYSTYHVRMYSMPGLLHKHRTHSHKLNDPMPDGWVYGSEQSPLTHNIHITASPPVILEVRCRDRDVMVTMPPCHYIMWPWDKAKGYCCFSVATGEMVENGCLEAEPNSLEERVALHADDSCRIIQMKNSQLRVLKLVSQPDSTVRKMVEDFSIDFSANAGSQPSVPSTSLSGRVIKRKVPEDCQQISDRTVLSMMYCEDMDMIVILSLFESSSLHEDHTTAVGFYDNWTGQLHRQFLLTDAPTDEVSERFFSYEEDTVTHVFRTMQGKMECHVYKIQPRDMLATANTKAKSRKGRRRLR